MDTIDTEITYDCGSPEKARQLQKRMALAGLAVRTNGSHILLLDKNQENTFYEIIEDSKNALHKLFKELRERFPNEAEEIIERYRKNAAADSRASRERERMRIEELRKWRNSNKG